LRKGERGKGERGRGGRGEKLAIELLKGVSNIENQLNPAIENRFSKI